MALWCLSTLGSLPFLVTPFLLLPALWLGYVGLVLFRDRFQPRLPGRGLARGTNP